MKTLLMTTLFIVTSATSFAASKSPQTLLERCTEMGEKMEMEQFKYHDTVARMTVQLRQSSTPTIPINLNKVNDYMSALKKSKKTMSRLVESKLYTKCF
jgi:hypothetical protein